MVGRTVEHWGAPSVAGSETPARPRWRVVRTYASIDEKLCDSGSCAVALLEPATRELRRGLFGGGGDDAEKCPRAYARCGVAQLLASATGWRPCAACVVAGCRDPALRSMADWLRDLETREGNWPSSLPDARAKLVHFCHGAPGVVFAMAEAFRVYGDEAFRDACLRGAETVWRYGLLMKGPGLCHGIAGNGYALLAAFRATGDVKWLHRACVFAETGVAEDTIAMSHTPDHPLSLFEGLAGCACFLRDLRQHPKDAELPFFEFHGL